MWQEMQGEQEEEKSVEGGEEDDTGTKAQYEREGGISNLKGRSGNCRPLQIHGHFESPH